MSKTEIGGAMFDVRDVMARVEELESERDSFTDGADTESGTEALAKLWADENTDDAAELATLTELLEEVKGNGGDEQWRGDWYPVTFVRDSDFTDYARDLCADIGDVPRDMPSYLVIDWDATAGNIQQDYTSIEFDGDTYWYR